MLLISYLRDGFRLLSGHLVLFLYSAFLTLVIQLADMFPAFRILAVLAAVFQVSISYSLPALLEEPPGENYHNRLFFIVLHNIKRLVIPVVILFGFLLGSMSIFVVVFHGDITKLPSWMGILGAVTASLFSFAPLFFSLEHVGLFRSFWLSIRYCMLHKDFYAVMLISTTLQSIPAIYLFQRRELLILQQYVILYITFGVMASALTYYKTHPLSRS